MSSINQRGIELSDALIADASALRVRVEQLANGTRIVDAGIDCVGGVEAGRRIAEICMGGLGSVSFSAAGPVEDWAANLCVHSTDPVSACLGSQYAGWSLSHGEGKQAFHALGSGPARILAKKEKLFDELNLDESADRTVLVLEVDALPPVELADKIAATCGVAAEALTLILTPTRSLAGTTQVVARVLEVALHKVHELHFPLSRVVDGVGSAPLPPPAPDFVTAMGRTNDAILFGGQVHLYVDAQDDDVRALADALPSSASRDYGRPFAEVFKAYEYDFFKIDPMLFSPARVSVTNMASGNSFRAGSIDHALLATAFGIAQ
ncbi:methenyltetrahydromethanopterin cyclohydrolase [Thiosocius teredinicola]|uniref:methenyltetrahydromethanopterin cyclohydrolase n=1 Tax=Thiosocius teredinicola TaxID=1973002 RepID=UPI002FE49884